VWLFRGRACWPIDRIRRRRYRKIADVIDNPRRIPKTYRSYGEGGGSLGFERSEININETNEDVVECRSRVPPGGERTKNGKKRLMVTASYAEWRPELRNDERERVKPFEESRTCPVGGAGA